MRPAGFEKLKIAYVLALAVLLALMNTAVPLWAEQETGDGGLTVDENGTTFIPDLEAGISGSDPDWDLLFDSYTFEGSITGTALTDAGVYGVGFKHKTPGYGVTSVSAKITVPGEKKYVQLGLRLNDYTDMDTEKKGIRVCVGSDGQLGLLSANGKTVNSRDTGYSFASGRMLYLEDDADRNVITVFTEENGSKIKLAECAIEGRKATLKFADSRLEPVEVDYSHDIYADGYISITTSALNVSITALSISVPAFYPAPVSASSSASDTSARSGSMSGEDIALYFAAAGLLLAVIAAAAILLVREKR